MHNNNDIHQQMYFNCQNSLSKIVRALCSSRTGVTHRKDLLVMPKKANKIMYEITKANYEGVTLSFVARKGQLLDEKQDNIRY